MDDHESCIVEKKAIVAGATGFIGANMVRRLIAQGYKVGGMTRKESSIWRIEGIIDQVELHRVDYGNQEEVSNIMRKYHPTQLFNCTQPDFMLLNDKKNFGNVLCESIQVLSCLLEASTKLNGLKSFVHCCSSNIYDWSSDAYLLSEGTLINPTTLRGIVKSTERDLCRYYVSKNNCPVRLARIFRAYGPWDAEDKLIVKTLQSIYQSKELSIAQSEFKRDYVYVGDLVKGMIAFAESDAESGSEINFGGGQDYSAGEIVNRIEKLSGLNVVRSSAAYPKNNYDKGRFLSSIQKAKDVLGWQPRTTIDEGLSRTIDWYKQYNKL